MTIKESEQETFEYILALMIIEGLQRGFAKYLRRPVRIAVIFSTPPKDVLDFWVCDPYGLLNGHESIVEKYLKDPANVFKANYEYAGYPERPGPAIPGTYSRSFQSLYTYYQLWIVEVPEKIFSTEPLAAWLDMASVFFVHHISTAHQSVYYGTAVASLLIDFGASAVQRAIERLAKERVGIDSFDASNIVDAASAIAKTVEEGSLPVGQILVPLRELAKDIRQIPFDPPAGLSSYKHVSKLLAAVAEAPTSYLLSDGTQVTALSHCAVVPEDSVIVRFKRSNGEVYFGNEQLCSFYDDKFFGTDKPSLQSLLGRSNLFSSVSSEMQKRIADSLTAIVQAAQRSHHGCSLVIDFDDCPADLIAGHRLGQPIEVAPVSAPKEVWEMVMSASAIDGAIQIQVIEETMRVVGFGCILAGNAMPKEDRSRGARHTSARRFTSSYNQAIVVVVSEDGPVSVFEHGAPIAFEVSERLPKAPTPDSVEDKRLTVQRWLAKGTPASQKEEGHL